MKRFIQIILIFAYVFLVNYSFGYTLVGNNNKILSMTEIKAEVTINNQLATTKLEQTFINNSSEYVETIYRFKPTEKATIQEFIFIDSEGNKYTGKVDEKEKAENNYVVAQSQGYQAAILKEDLPNQFETKAGKVAPNSKCKIIIVYTELLDYKDGTISFRLPFEALKNSSQDKVILTSVSVKLHDQKEIIEVNVPDYPTAGISKRDRNHYEIFYEKSDLFPNKDFVITYKLLSRDLAVSCITTKPEEDEAGYFVLLLAPQEIIETNQIVAKNIVFVMDVSGSMSGDKIDQTKRAFSYFLDFLNPEDSFNLITFSSDVNVNFNSLVPVNENNIKKAKEYLLRQPAVGGTNIYNALQSALKMFEDNEKTKAIIFLTDGEPTSGIIDIDKIAKDFKDNNNLGVKLFVVGVGDDLNRRLLDKLALENYGDTIYLQEGSLLEEKLKAFYDNISKPLLVDISVDFDRIEVFDVYPKNFPNLYKGNQLIISGRYKNGIGSTTIYLKGRVNKEKIRIPISANFVQSSNENLVVSKVWAKMKADHLILEMRAYGETQDKKNEVIALSKKYQFITPYTSFVARTETPINPPTSLINALNNQSNQKNNNLNFNNTSQMNIKQQNNKFIHSTFQTSDLKPINTGNNPPPPPTVVVRTTEAANTEVWGLYSFLPLAAVAIPNFRKAREQSRQKACWANCRVIQGALEMYNMDRPSNEGMDEMNEHNLKILHTLGYLKEIPKCPSDFSSNKYFGSNLTSNGVIYCAIHGSPGSVINLEDSNSKYYVPWQTKTKNMIFTTLIFFINCILFIIGMYLNIYIFILLPYRFISKSIRSLFGSKT